jgi:hypothetical protein
MPADHLDVTPPDHLMQIPRDERGFIVPAESPWEGALPQLSRYDLPRTLGLALGRACAVCGFELQPGNPVWRAFSQRDAATARIQGELVDDLSAPGHESCMVYSMLVCPYWRSAGARLGKDSSRGPSAPRGTRPAVLGYQDVCLAVEAGKDLLNTAPPAFKFLYRGPVADVPFRTPAEDLAARYEDSLQRDSCLADLDENARFYWGGAEAEEARLFRYIEKGVPTAFARREGSVQGHVMYERLRMESIAQ